LLRLVISGATEAARSPLQRLAAEGRFGKGDFIDDARRDVYVCPAGQIAPYRFTYEEKSGLQIRRYWSSACPGCPMKEQCTPAPQLKSCAAGRDLMAFGSQRRSACAEGVAADAKFA